jgi:hypothetical protein
LTQAADPETVRLTILRGAGMKAALKAGAAYFAVVYLIGFLLGTIRVLLLAPRLGDTAAVLFESPIILAASWVVSHWSADTFVVRAKAAPRLVMGGSAFVLLIVGELAVSILAFGRSWEETAATYRSLPGLVGLLGQVAFALFPLAQAALARGRNRPY